MKYIFLLCTISFLFISKTIFSQAGMLDPDFGEDGIVTRSIGPYNDEANAMTIQPDGKIIIAGFSSSGTDTDFALARFNSDGTIDYSFGVDGYSILNLGYFYEIITDIALQTDGKIIVGGDTHNDANYDFAIVRFNTNGIIDSTFGVDGIQSVDFGSEDGIRGIVIQEDDKIIAVGSALNGPMLDFAVARFTANGFPDNSFDGDGKLLTDLQGGNDTAFDVEVQADGKIVVVGQSQNEIDYYDDFAIVRYKTDGTLDSTFNSNGIVIKAISDDYDYATCVNLQTDQKILAAGRSNSGFSDYDFAVLRINPDGTIDETFNEVGFKVDGKSGDREEANAMTIQQDGKILLGGGVELDSDFDMELLRFNTDGTEDFAFGASSSVITSINPYEDHITELQMTSEGKILAAGYTFNGESTDFALVRYLSGLNLGVINFSNADQIVKIYPNPIVHEALLQYELTTTTELSVNIFNLQGEKISCLIHKQIQEAGKYEQRILIPEELPHGNYLIILSSDIADIAIQISK